MPAAARDTQTSVICRYYDGCTAGDPDLLQETLHPDVVHYFLAPNPGSRPVKTRESLINYWCKVTRKIDARWVVERSVSMRDETVIEWTLYWRTKPGTERITTRGAEWFVFRDGLIFEIRSYYQQINATSELEAFDYFERGYSTAGKERSMLHPEATDFSAPQDT